MTTSVCVYLGMMSSQGLFSHGTDQAEPPIACLRVEHKNFTRW